MGGNVFGNVKPIRKEDIRPTLVEFLRELRSIFPNASKHLGGLKVLGSAGKKDISGDIDLALDEKALTDERDWGIAEDYVEKLFLEFQKRAKTSTVPQLIKKAKIVALAQKIEQRSSTIKVDIKGSSSGTLFLSFPQFEEGGKEKPGYSVQVDINVGDSNWLKFSYYSSTYSGNVKGLHRTQLLVALFSNKGYIFSHNYGIKDRETQEIKAKSPDEALELLNQLYRFKIGKSTVQDYFKLVKYLRANLSSEDLSALWDTYLKILDRTRADIPEDLQEYWVENRERLGLTGKFLPKDSKLVQFKYL